MTTVVFLVLALMVVVGTALVVTGRWTARLGPGDRPAAAELPAGPWSPEDVTALRFRVGLRGYRMQDVDAALTAVADELRRRDDADAEPDGTR